MSRLRRWFMLRRVDRMLRLGRGAEALALLQREFGVLTGWFVYLSRVM